MAIAHRLPSRLPARHGGATGHRAADYRAVVEGLLAAGVTSNEAVAAALNADPRYTPPGRAWDAVAVERLLRFLCLRAAGHATAAPGVAYRPARAHAYGAPMARPGPTWS